MYSGTKCSGGFSHGSKGSMEPPFLASTPRYIRLCAAIRFRLHGTLSAFWLATKQNVSSYSSPTSVSE